MCGSATADAALEFVTPIHSQTPGRSPAIIDLAKMRKARKIHAGSKIIWSIPDESNSALAMRKRGRKCSLR
jgi:hypothetical protein